MISSHLWYKHTSHSELREKQNYTTAKLNWTPNMSRLNTIASLLGKDSATGSLVNKHLPSLSSTPY